MKLDKTKVSDIVQYRGRLKENNNWNHSLVLDFQGKCNTL